MPKLGVIKFRGASGTEYPFDVYRIDTNWEDNIAAVYFVTCRYQKNDVYHHKKIYVGQTNDLKARHSNHHRALCFSRHDANALCILQESSETKRQAIESDLIDGYDLPCNRQ